MAFDSGAVETMIMWDELQVFRCLMETDNGDQAIEYYTQYQLDHNEHLKGEFHHLKEKVYLTEWMAENHKQKQTWPKKSQKTEHFADFIGHWAVGHCHLYRLDCIAGTIGCGDGVFPVSCDSP